MPCWVSIGDRVIASDEAEQNGPRPKLSVTRDGTIFAMDVWVRSPAQSIEFPATQAVSIAAPVAVTGAFWQATQPVSGAFFQATQPVSIAAPVGVTGAFWQATQPVSGAFWQATQPVSAAALPLPAGAATGALQGTGNTSVASIDTKTPALGQAAMAASRPVVLASNQSPLGVTGTFWQTTQPVSGAFFQATQPVSIAAAVGVTGTFWQATQPVSGTFWQATQPVSAAALPLPTGAATETTLAAVNTKTPALGQAAMAASSPVVLASNQSPVPVNATAIAPSSLCVTVTAAANTLTTCTLPAVAGQFHYIVSVSITMYCTAARTGGATPVVSTTTNLPGTPAFTWESAQAVGTSVRQTVELGGNPLKSAVANTATTIVGPATASVIWRITTVYYTAA